MAITLQQDSFVPDRQLYNFNIIAGSENVGIVQLRLKPAKSQAVPDGFESHVYYEVLKDHQGKGYATEALKEIIKKAAGYSINPLIITVNADNAASIKVLKKCGGKLEGQADTDAGVRVLKYSVPTAGK